MKKFNNYQMLWIRYWLQRLEHGTISRDEFEHQIYKECRLQNENITYKEVQHLVRNILSQREGAFSMQSPPRFS
ncbi:MAG: hypothetical protein KA369_23495 [Spirochaetes bacterium]|nr:hypothetical protein [Spirochaetota bacterium]